MQGNPSKYVRRAFFDVLNNITVSGNQIPCYTRRVTGTTVPKHYILLQAVGNSENKYTKCADRWNTTITIETLTTFPATGNTGSEVLLDDIVEQVINLEETINISGGYKINQRELVSSDNIEPTIGTTSNVFRNITVFNYFLTQ